MKNKEKFLAGQPFVLPAIKSGIISYMAPGESEVDRCGSINGGFADGGNVSKIGRDRIKIYSYWFGQPLKKWIYFSEMDFEYKTNEHGLFPIYD